MKGLGTLMLKQVIAIGSLVALAACGGAESDSGNRAPFAPTVSPDDLSVLVGDDWQGELTYLDYGDNKTETTLPVNLLVGQNDRTFELHFTFPDEPQANGRAEINISDDGRQLNDETLVRRLEDGSALMLVTHQACDDNGVNGDCEFTYMIAPDAFSITKMVTPEGSDAAYRRNHYLFTRS